MAVVDVVNAALRHIGATTIMSLTDGSTNADIASALYPVVYKEVFRRHDWKCLRRRTKPAYTATTLTLSSAAVGTGVTATAGAAHFAAEDIGRELIEVDADGVDGDGKATITGFTIGGTVVTVENTVAWTGVGPHAANRWRLVPHQNFGVDWPYEYVRPTDWVKVVDATYGAAWQEERGRILADTSYGLTLIGTYYETDESAWDALLRSAMEHRLAAALAEPITGSDKKLVERMYSLYRAIVAEAEVRDRQSTSPLSYLPTFRNQGR